MSANYADVNYDICRFNTTDAKQERTGAISGPHGRVTLIRGNVRDSRNIARRTSRLPDTR